MEISDFFYKICKTNDGYLILILIPIYIMANPTYPLDRRVLEIIMALTETTREVNLDAEAKATNAVFEKISTKVADEAWEMVRGNRIEDERTKEYKPKDPNTWKRVFGHNNMSKGSTIGSETLNQILLFLDYAKWEDVEDDLDELYQRVVVEKQPKGKAEDVSVQTPYTSFSHLRPGDELDVYWPKSSIYEAPGEACMKIRYLGSYGTYGAPKFHINAVQNCSLEAGEDFDAQCLEEGMKIMLTNRRLNNRHKGNYVSGQAVTSIKVFPKKDC